MKLFFVIFLICGLPLAAFARLPYSAIEKLRQQTIVVRVSLDNPNSEINKKCGIRSEHLAQIGYELKSITEINQTQWRKIKIQDADLPLLKNRIAICAERGSCSVYSAFLESIKIDDENTKKQVQSIRAELDIKLSNLKSETYIKALTSLKDPCSILLKFLK